MFIDEKSGLVGTISNGYESKNVGNTWTKIDLECKLVIKLGFIKTPLADLMGMLFVSLCLSYN
jgi:hypothetical protein